MPEALDIEKLKKAADEQQEFESLDFLFLKHPEDNKFYAYRATFAQEPREFTSKAGNKYDCADCKVVQVVNDKDVKAGEKRTMILHYVLLKKLKQHAPIKDKTFDIMGKGLVSPKKGGRPYYNFAVLLQEGTLEASALTRLLPTTN